MLDRLEMNKKPKVTRLEVLTESGTLYTIDVLTLPQQRKVPFDEAWMICATLEYNGYNDWRLPTPGEYLHPIFKWSWHGRRVSAFDNWWNVQPVRTVHE